jgi:DNA-binding MarR family transcriptional regulator
LGHHRLKTDQIRSELDVLPVIMRTIRGEMRSRRNPELSVDQFRVLMILDYNPDASLSTMAGHPGLTSPIESKMINVLVANHLVTRWDISMDHRRGLYP